MNLGSGVVKVTVATGGSGYASAPAVSLTGGGGTGAAAVAQMAGTAVQAVVITNAGTGYDSAPTVAFAAATGGGAAATASVLAFSATRPITFFKGRWNDLYGIDGYGRGFRWDGETPQLEPLGIAKPASLAAPTGSTASQKNYVSAVQVLDGGYGYSGVPTVTFTGGGATTQAAGVAIIANGRVTGVRLTERGAGYTAAPQVAFSGGLGSSAAFTCNVTGSLIGFDVTGSGVGYTGAPTLTLHNTQGLTGANAVVDVNTDAGQVIGVSILAAGSGATGTGVTASLTGGGATTQASVSPILEYTVSALSIANSGAGYMTPPVITFVTDPSDTLGSGAAATCSVNAAGQISAVTMLAGGRYLKPPTAVITDSSAIATASVSPTLRGTYKCAIRYLDNTPESQGGPIPSSISELQEVDASDGLQSLTWSFNHHGLESRVAAMELWRTTADQAVVLYRVATIQAVGGELPNATYVDTLSDKDLLDTARSGYGLMPIVLPSGQVNARRFEPPPETMAVGCMFQDRAWYAVDTTGSKPNSLYYSEVDEPESVPAANELVLQENVPDSDAIVALIPFGSSLLVAQSRHTYRMQYVAQPVIDASIALVSYRGVLSSRCWDVFAGVAFMADDYGLYAFDGNSEEAISAPVDNYWRDGIIDFSKKKWFYVKVHPGERVVRFFYCRSTDGTYPPRALCYSMATQAWWEEVYAQAVPHSAVAPVGNRQEVLYGGEAGGLLKPHAGPDVTSAGATAAIAYDFRTGPMTLANEGGDRSVGICYSPTAETLSLSLHYNNSSTARANAIASNRGDGFVAGGTAATLNMAADRSALGTATGHASARYSGRVDEQSAGADRHVAVALSGTQASGSVELHAMTVTGVK
jgi:hypothetical protein